jgi:hypothetical protein
VPVAVKKAEALVLSSLAYTYGRLVEVGQAIFSEKPPEVTVEVWLKERSTVIGVVASAVRLAVFDPVPIRALDES